MSFGGSGNRQDTSPVTTTTTNNSDQRIVADGGSTAVNASNAKNSTINLLDGGAIKASFDFAKANDANAYGNYQNLLTTTSTAMTGILNGIAGQQNFIASTTADAKGSMDNKTLLMISLGALMVVGIFAMRKT